MLCYYYNIREISRVFSSSFCLDILDFVVIEQSRTCDLNDHNLNEYFVGAKRWMTKARRQRVSFSEVKVLLIDSNGEGEKEADDGCEEERWRWRWKRRIMRTRRESGSEAIVRGVEACLRCDN